MVSRRFSIRCDACHKRGPWCKSETQAQAAAVLDGIMNVGAKNLCCVCRQKERELRRGAERQAFVERQGRSQKSEGRSHSTDPRQTRSNLFEGT
jgi:hypothetical protein